MGCIEKESFLCRKSRFISDGICPRFVRYITSVKLFGSSIVLSSSAFSILFALF
ncbi:hypothetical protein ES703_88979 [subsurface metagenome]